MTVDQCHSQIADFRRRQGTATPEVCVDFAGAVYSGRVTRADSDPGSRDGRRSPYGLLVLEHLGLARGPETILQIADIPEGGIRAINEG